MPSRGRLFADDGFVARVSKLTGVDFDPNAGTRQNKAAAKLDEQMLLGRVRVPPGSQPIAKSQESRTWRVHLPLDQVFAWEDAHRPRGSTKDGAGTGSKWGVLTDRELMYLYPPIAGRISDRRLNFNLIVKPGGWTRIYVWVQDTPIVARSPNERLPVGVTQVVFRSHLITDHAKVAKIVHWFDALPIVQPGIGSCAWYSSNSSVVHLDFGNAAGNVVAHASLALRYGLRSDRCSPITFDVGGHPQSPIDGGDFFRRVKRLVG